MNCAHPVLLYFVPWARCIVPLQQTVDRRDACPTEEFVDLFPPHPNTLSPRGERTRYLKMEKEKNERKKTK